jgi:hypothetical protein
MFEYPPHFHSLYTMRASTLIPIRGKKITKVGGIEIGKVSAILSRRLRTRQEQPSWLRDVLGSFPIDHRSREDYRSLPKLNRRRNLRGTQFIPSGDATDR